MRRGAQEFFLCQKRGIKIPELLNSPNFPLSGIFLCQKRDEKISKNPIDIFCSPYVNLSIQRALNGGTKGEAVCKIPFLITHLVVEMSSFLEVFLTYESKDLILGKNHVSALHAG